MKTRAAARQSSRGADEGWAVLSTLMSGFVVFGGVGWLLDHWWGTRLITPIGLIVGMGLGIYAVVMQFGRPPAPGAASASAASTGVSSAVLPVDPSDGPPPADTRRETERP